MAWEGFGCRKEGNKKEVVTPPSADKQWSRRGSFSKSRVGMFSKYKESLFKAHKLCYGSIVIVLSPWHSIWSSGTGVFTEAFLDCINWCGALHAVGLGLFQKERERWARVFFRGILGRLLRAFETRLYVGGLESFQNVLLSRAEQSFEGKLHFSWNGNFRELEIPDLVTLTSTDTGGKRSWVMTE